jgi:anti-sigma28 factor (negative regulator of flagellin synthesis)
MGKDRAELLRIRAKIQVLAAQVLRCPEIRQEKVTALRRAILAGGYQPTADQLAQAVFMHMLVKPAA